MRIVGDAVIAALEERMSHHDKCRFAYVSWRVPRTYQEREALVEKHIRPPVSFEAGGKEIFWEQTLSFETGQDREHVVYRSVVTVDGKKSNITAIKKAMQHLARDVGDAMRKTARLVQAGAI